tara:strand:+ start:662 stop:868 length:207 start_codon:yes stop_codon:yes gene_type:complete
MENRNRIIELLTAVRYTTNDIEKVADEICSLFNFVWQSEQLADEPFIKFERKSKILEAGAYMRPNIKS